jgi:hypothetical protein
MGYSYKRGCEILCVYMGGIGGCFVDTSEHNMVVSVVWKYYCNSHIYSCNIYKANRMLMTLYFPVALVLTESAVKRGKGIFTTSTAAF